VPNKPGPKPALESTDLAFHTAFALGRGMSIKDVAIVAAISSSTVLRFATRAGLTNDKRCLEIVKLVHESEIAKQKANVQYDEEIWDPGLDLLS
jgi:hypothetical protein